MSEAIITPSGIEHRDAYNDLSLDAEELPIDGGEVARLSQCGSAERWQEPLQAALQQARSLVQPRARWVEVSDDAIGTLFPSETPVAAIAEQGQRWAFICTVGDALETAVRTYMSEGAYLQGLLLDAAGSIAADSLAQQVEDRCSEGQSSARFSPGYCSWTLDAQPEIFSMLNPTDLGIELGSSRLMNPLKSVSGIVVCAPSKALKVAPETCRQCEAVGCTRRPMGNIPKRKIRP